MPDKTQEKIAYSTGSQPDDKTLETRDILSNHKFALAVTVGDDEQELATPILHVTAFLQTDLFLVHLFFCERKAALVQ